MNGFAELEPALMLNAIGYTEDGFEEDDSNTALISKKTHNHSVEAGAGLFLKKKIATSKYGKLGFKIGGIYYRELSVIASYSPAPSDLKLAAEFLNKGIILYLLASANAIKLKHLGSGE